MAARAPASPPPTPTGPQTPEEEDSATGPASLPPPTGPVNATGETAALGTDTQDDAVPNILEPDPDGDQEDPDWDNDSAYNSETASRRTASISSSIFHYRYENGRRYHAYREGQYVLPNDDAEQERLDLQHHIWRLLLNGNLYTAPLPPESKEEPLRILDLGCGTGIWAIDMADEFPNATVLGVDLSPIQPTWVPMNCQFHVDDYEDEWTWRDDEKFDYIHGRALSGSSSDWPRFYRQVRQHLKPGGWVEMQEYDTWVFSDDDSCDRAPWTMEWIEKMEAASRRFGKPMNVAKYHKQWMIDAGFEDVKEQVHRIPIGPWTQDPALKELGRFEQIHMQMSVESHAMALLTRIWEYSTEQVKVLVEGVKREFRNNKDLHLITSYRFISGRNPAGVEQEADNH